MIKAVVFDLDGTILDTLTDLHTAVNFALKKCNFPPVSFDKTRLSVGNGVEKLVRRCMPEGRESDFERCFGFFKQQYALCKEDNTAPYKGAIECINALRANGIKTAVVSNKAEWAVVELCEKYFPSLFDAVLGDDGIRPLKPSPEAISSSLEIMSVEKENAVYVGDQEVDGLSAKNAGLPLLGAAWGFRGEKALRDAGATEIFTDFSQLEEYILSRAKNLLS